METKQIWVLVVGVLIVAIVASVISANIAGNVIKVNDFKNGKYSIYTTSEMDNKLAAIYIRLAKLEVGTTPQNSSMPQNNTICTSYPKIVVYKAALSEQEVSDNMTRVRIANIQLDDMNPLGEGEVVLEFIEGKETTINFRGEPAKLTYHAASDKNMSGPGYIDVLWKGTRERIIDKGFFVIW